MAQRNSNVLKGKVEKIHKNEQTKDLHLGSMESPVSEGRVGGGVQSDHS